MKRIISLSALKILPALIVSMVLILSGRVYSDWSKMNSFPNVFTNNIFISGNTLYAASGSGIYKSTNGGTSWQQFNSGLSNPQAVQCEQVIQVGSVLYAATVDGIYKSTDFAETWVKKSDGIFVGNGAIYAFCESVYELNGTLFTGGYTGLYRSTNGGENWLPTNITGMHIWAKNFTMHNGILFAARETNNSPIGYKSSDNGLTWTSLTGLSFFATITFLSEPGKLFAGTIHGAWLSTNNGLNWEHRAAGLTPDPYNSSFVRVNTVLVTSLKFGGSGMYKSTNDGVLWENFGQGLPSLLSIDKIVVFNNKILAATSAGIYERNISEVTGITQVSSQVPSDFALGQNYPNPFNPVTKISFSLPEAGYVSLRIFDIAGHELSEPVKQIMSAGTYSVDFDASKHSSGVYFYRLEAGSYTETKRMVLIK